MTDVKEEVQSLLSELTELYNAGDMKGVADLYTDDFKMMYAGRGVLTGKQVAEMAHQRMKAENVHVVNQSVEETGGMGDEAWARGVTTLTRGEENNTEYVNYLFILKRVDSKWRIHVSSVCPDAPKA